MDRLENIPDYITRTLSIVNQTKANGEDVSELQNIEKVLWTLTFKFDYMLQVLKNQKTFQLWH